MGETTQADAKRLRYELGYRASRRKRAEGVFIGAILCVMCLLGGYLLGVNFPPKDGDVPEFARKLGKFKK